MTNRSLCKAGAYQRGLRPRPPCRRFLIVNFGPRPHTLDHTRRSLLRALVRNYIFICVIIARCNLDTQPVEEEQGKRKGRGKKRKERKKRKEEIRNTRVYIYVYVWWRTSVRSSFRSPHVVCPVRSSFVAGEEGGGEHRESFSGPCFYDNEQNWRTCALVSTDNKVHLCNQRLLGGGAGALKRPQHE